MRLFIRFLLLTFLVLNSVLSAEPFFNKWYQANLNYSDDWTSVPATDDEKFLILKLKHKNYDATISVSGYTYAEAVTVNAFKDRRIAAAYDGWRHIAEREVFDHELTRVNAHEGYFSIYSKTEMNERLKKESMVVAEYYFIVDKKGYVFSLRTPRKEFQQVQADYKKVFESFWIGEGDKPVVLNRSRSVMDWEMVGKNAANHRSLGSRFDPEFPYQLVWTKDMEKTGEVDHTLYSKGYIIQAKGQSLTCLSAHDGAEKWQYDLKYDIMNQMMVFDKTLYVVVEPFGDKELLMIDFERGRQIRRIRLSSSEISDPVISGNLIYMVEGSSLVARDVASGDVKWQSDVRVSAKFYPVISGNAVVVVSSDQRQLMALKKTDGSQNWQIELETDIMYSPVISNSVILVSHEGLTARTDDHIAVTAFDLQSGNLVWTYESSQRSSFMVYNPSLSGHFLHLYTKQSRQMSLQVIDVNTGALAWSLPFDMETKPLVTQRYVYVLAQTEKPVLEEGLDPETLPNSDYRLIAYDPASGLERFDVPLLTETFGEDEYPRSIDAYKQYVFLYYDHSTTLYAIQTDEKAVNAK